jgi:hypothetical protein
MTWVLELSRTANLPVFTLLYRLHFVKDKSMSAKDVLYASDPESESSSKITTNRMVEKGVGIQDFEMKVTGGFGNLAGRRIFANICGNKRLFVVPLERSIGSSKLTCQYIKLTS